MGVEGFTFLAIIEAQDKISRVLEQIDGSYDKFSSAAERAAESATVSGERIDASLLETASGADAVELSDARLQAAQDKLAVTTKAQADAERVLLDAQAQAAAAADGDTAATQRAVAANDALTAAQKKTALASKEVSAAQEQQAAVQKATVLATDEGRAAADAAAAAQEKQALTQKQGAAAASSLQSGMKLAALGVAAVGYESVKAAANFQSMTEHLVTDAGESQQNIGMIRAGMLQLATTTGTTTDQMAAGMYHIESAGYHGQQALDVLKVAAEGAKVGGADLDTIGQSLTGTMNAFGPSAGTATQMMNAMIATVGAGDMKMQDFGSSLGNVAAIGASAGLSFAQVAGGVATMTAQNVTAQRATQDLAHTIGSLSNPTNTQIKEMSAMGINSTQLSANLGKQGLTGTFDTLVQAIAAHTKGGEVFVQALDKSKVAAQQASQALGQMSPPMQKMAQAWAAGTMSTKDFDKAISALPPAQQTLYKQFESLTKKSGSFTDALNANNPTAQTFNAALAKMAGGTTGLNTILMLTGQHASTFQQNVQTISDAAHKSGSAVDNWSAIQSTFNQKIDRAKASVEAAGISIGTVLLPVVSKIASVITNILGPTASWIAQHQKWVGLALAVAGGIMAMVAAMKAWEIVQGVINALTAIFALEEAAILSPIELVAIAIAALAAGLYYAWTHFKTFREVVTAVFDAVKTAAVDVWHALETAWKAVAAAAVTVWHALETAWNAIVGAAETAGHAIASVWDTVTSFVSKLWDANVVVAKSIASKLVAAWNAVVGAAEAVWHALETAWNAVKSATETVWNAISGFFEKWWPLLLVLFATPIAILISIWNHCHAVIQQVAEAVWGAISGFFVGTWQAIASAAETAWGLIQDYIWHPMQDLWNWLVGLWNDLTSQLVGIWHDITGYASKAWAGIKAGAQADWALIKQYVIQPMQDAWNWLVGMWNDLTGWLSQMWHTIVGQAQMIWAEIKTAIIQPLVDAWNSVTLTISNIAGSIWNGLVAAWHAVENVGSWFSSIGDDIINGIVSGVENAGGKLFDSLKNIAKGALGAAKSFLGISSPSKAFAEQVGQWIPAGIAEGVTGNAGVAHAAVRNLAGALPGLAAVSVVGSGGGGLVGGVPFTSGAAAGGGTNITIDLRNSQVLGNGAMNQLATVIGQQLTRQLAPAGVQIRA